MRRVFAQSIAANYAQARSFERALMDAAECPIGKAWWTAARTTWPAPRRNGKAGHHEPPCPGQRRHDQAEYARHAGVNRSQITRWLQNGRITALPSGLIDPVAADAQRSATESPLPHHQARKAQIESEKEQTQTQSAGAETGPGSRARHPGRGRAEPHAQARNLAPAKAKAERENMELDVRQGSGEKRSEVDMVLADLGATLRARLEALPDRTPQVHRHPGTWRLHKYLPTLCGLPG